jgi:hypothetical protein
LLGVAVAVEVADLLGAAGSLVSRTDVSESSTTVWPLTACAYAAVVTAGRTEHAVVAIGG